MTWSYLVRNSASLESARRHDNNAGKGAEYEIGENLAALLRDLILGNLGSILPGEPACVLLGGGARWRYRFRHT